MKVKTGIDKTGGGGVNLELYDENPITGHTAPQATGDNAVAIGDWNEATGDRAVVVGGRQNIASGAFSITTGGVRARATRTCERAFAATASHQFSEFIAAANTTNDTPTEATLHNAGKITIPENYSLAFKGFAQAVQRPGGSSGTVGDSKSWEFSGIIRNVSGTTSLVGAVTPTVIDEVAAATTWDIAITADDTGDYLKLEGTAENDKNILFTFYISAIQTGGW